MTMLETLLFVLAILFFLPYPVLILIYRKEWSILKQFESKENTRHVSVSIVVPMRNEENHIEQLLHDLLQQNYPSESYHIYVVDDHSTDNSPCIVDSLSQKYPNISLFWLPEGKRGKKAAIAHSLPFLHEELVITIDADCHVRPEWLSTIAAFYVEYQPAMIICPIIFRHDHSILSQCQALEMLSLTGCSAASASWGHPVMCSGANLAIEKDIMLKYAYIYESPIMSGDDMMMMIEIKKEHPERIKYLKSVATTVETIPQSNVKGFIRQRNRWTSKSPKYTDKDVITVALIVFMANLTIIACLLAGFFYIQFIYLAIMLWILKSIADFMLLHLFCNFWNEKKLMRIYAIAQFLYPFYVVWVGIAGNIVPVKWKDRKSKRVILQ